MAHKTIGDAEQNLRESVMLIGNRYETGIKGASWQAAAMTDQAEQNYAAGVQRAVADGTRKAGIAGVSDIQWREAAITKGKGIIGDRIIAALPKYRANFAPILAAMNQAATDAPPRTASARQNVTQRLLPVIEAAQRAAGKTVT